MQEHHHTKTTPGEPIAPEIVPHAVHVEPGGQAQSEDINIPLVTVSVAGFAVFLLLSIVSLQAWFYNADNAERDAKWRPDPVLTNALAQYDHELHAPAGPNSHIPNGESLRHVPIETAIDATVKQYANAQGSQNK